VITLGGVFRVYCTFLYMEGVAVLNVKIRMMLGGVFRVQCLFPYMEGMTVLNEKD
jgi:hypothetical protein